MLQGKKQVAIEALGKGLSVEKASELANVSRTSLYRWLKEPDFQAEIYRIQSEMIGRLSLRLLNICELAIQALEDGLNSRDIKLRLKVAEIALSRLPSLSELGSLNERITKLENINKGA